MEGRPPAEGLPTAFVAVLIGFAILLAGLVAYGVVRWREDRAVGQIALAIGWGGVAVAYVVFAGCARELTTGMPALTCSSIPAAIVLGILWLTLWLSLGLLVDYRLWTRPGGGGGEPDLVPPEPP